MLTLYGRERMGRRGNYGLWLCKGIKPIELNQNLSLKVCKITRFRLILEYSLQPSTDSQNNVSVCLSMCPVCSVIISQPKDN